MAEPNDMSVDRREFLKGVAAGAAGAAGPVTANAHAAHQCVDLNVASCLLKPFDLDTLFACVAAHSRVLS